VLRDVEQWCTDERVKILRERPAMLGLGNDGVHRGAVHDERVAFWPGGLHLL
jgi:hypothetical protein